MHIPCTYHAYTVVELRNLVLPDREWNVPGDGGGAGGDGGGGGGSGGDDGGVQGTKPEAVRAPPAEPRPPSGTGTRNLLCSKGCGRSFGWPPARASHEKLCKGGGGGGGGGGAGGGGGGDGDAERGRAAAPTKEERLSAGVAGAAGAVGAARPAQVARVAAVAAAAAAEAEDGRGTPLVAEEDLPTLDGTLPALTSPSPMPTN